MAESAVSFLLDKIDFFLSREWDLLSGINNEVDGLRNEFETIRALLIVVDTKGGINEQVRVWIKQVRDLAYDIEDVLDIFAFHMAQQSHQFPRWVTHLRRRHSIAILIQEINTRLRGMKETRERYQFIISSQASASGPENYSYLYPRVSPLYLDEAEIVGIEEPRDKLTTWAIKGESKLKVMFVVGMGGLGKTTLVKKVYETIKEGFNCSAWITISKSEKKEELLWTMFKRLFDSTNDQIPRGFHTTNEVELMNKMRGYLQRKRYVIVLDDLWSKDVWESIKNAFPNQNHGRIIITTRRGDIAHLCSQNYVTVHNLQPLPQEKAQELFYKTTFRPSGECPTGLVGWSNKILKRCDGLPLGIITVGNLLSKTEKSTDAWKRLHDSLGSELERNGRLSITMEVLSISYNDLPNYLKYCFLYMSIFPEDYAVKRGRLVRLWISEGLVKEVRGKTLEEVGEEYLEELMYRNLVQVSEIDFDGRARSCRVHDFLHKIILSKSHEENFCTVSTEPETSLNEKIRRLSIHKSCTNMLQKVFTCARTFFMFGIESLSNSTNQNILSSFSILKVLDLEGAPLSSFPTAITNLLLLRYLSLRNTNIKRLPKSLGKLHNLETLDLKQTFVTELHDKILKLGKLRHLFVYRYNILNYATIDCVQGFKASTIIGRLVALQKLSFIRVNKNSGMIEALENLTQLRKLGIIDVEEKDGKHLCHSIEKMTNLRTLDVTSIGEEEFLDLNAISTPPLLLRRLYLKGRLQKLPDWISSLHDLVRIRLKWSKLEGDPTDALQDLPNLMELQLLDAFTGSQLHFHPNKFQSLKILEIENLEMLEMVIMQRGTLSCLEKLIIRRCANLKGVPTGIEKLTQLKEFNLYDMPEELVKGLEKNGGKFYGLVKHISLIRSYSLQSRGHWQLRDLS
ncbi:hypothetical protein F0562_022444 [Nyssa sinensis]|uniref:AAA+ ATPase domain-containing protein n=1 Tax=Nyssa sinensis TaxID=561372 RepID=A0A5J5BRM1_9ASTE|nr:hypothetical protein F0562_022444 [Nyssa sinensis]